MTSDEQRLEQARDEVLERQARRVELGLCGCPCGRVLPVARSIRTRYLGERHRDAAHRERVKAEADALGVQVRQSLGSLETTARSGERRADAQTPRKRAQRRPRAGVSLYLPELELAQVLELWLEVLVRGSSLRLSGPAIADAEHVRAQLERALDRRRARA